MDVGSGAELASQRAAQLFGPVDDDVDFVCRGGICLNSQKTAVRRHVVIREILIQVVGASRKVEQLSWSRQSVSRPLARQNGDESLPNDLANRAVLLVEEEHAIVGSSTESQIGAVGGRSLLRAVLLLDQLQQRLRGCAVSK